MLTTNLRKVGGSVMLAVPPAILDLLQLRPGEPVDLAVEGGKLVMHPRRRPRYILENLLAEAKPATRRSRASREWQDDKPVGRELL